MTNEEYADLVKRKMSADDLISKVKHCDRDLAEFNLTNSDLNAAILAVSTRMNSLSIDEVYSALSRAVQALKEEKLQQFSLL